MSAATLVARITTSASAATVGGSFTLDGTGSHASGDNTLVSYQWAIVAGSTYANFVGATNAATATLAAMAAGDVTLKLTVTDSVGQQAMTTTVLTVVAPPPPPADDSGGGAMELGWLLGWLASVIGVWVVTPRRRGA